MNAPRILFAFGLLFASAAPTLTMQRKDSSLNARICNLLSEQNPGPDAFFTNLGNNALTELSTSDLDTQYNAYATAIHCDDYETLQKLETANIPVPDTSTLTFMLQYYALSYKMITPPIRDSYPDEIDIFSQVVVPDQPRVNAIRWCLEHNASASDKRTHITYKPLVAPMHLLKDVPPIAQPLFSPAMSLITGMGILNPLKHVVVYSNTPECAPLLTLMKEHGASLVHPISDVSGIIRPTEAQETKIECYSCIAHVLKEYPCPSSVDERISMSFTSCYKYENPNEIYRKKMQKISEILNLSTYKDVVLDDYMMQLIKPLIHDCRYKPSLYTQAWQLSNQLQLHAPRNLETATFLKSLFNCGKAAQQVTPQNNQ
jgi:hypothetical protein